jgi:hypothetical protein
MDTAREEKVIGLKPCDLDPLLHSFTGSCSDFKLDGALSLVLHHDSARCNLLTVADVPNFEGNEVTTTKLAVDAKVEESKLANAIFYLKAHAQSPDIFELERSFLTDKLALVPRLIARGVDFGSHDGLPSS